MKLYECPSLLVGLFFTLFLLSPSIALAAETNGEEPEIEIEIEWATESDTGGQPNDAEANESEADGIEIEWADEQEKKAAQAPVNFKGRLLERGSKRAIGNLTVYLKGKDEEALADAQGRFAFRGLAAGEYEIVIPSTEFETFETKERVEEGELTEVAYYLEPKVYGTLEVVVRGRKVKKEVSRRVLTVEEAKVIPGSLGDSVKVVENLPGVARGSSTGRTASAGGVVVRGSNAEDTRVLLDGHQIPLLFHFGGFKSVYNSELIDEINLYTGGFGVEYGDATGGIVDIKSRKPRSDRWGGYVDTSFIDASAMAEGPITEDISAAFALRRSTIDLVLPFVVDQIDSLTFATYPVYYDYQAKLDWKLDERNELTFDVYGLYDTAKIVRKTVNDDEPELTGDIGFTTTAHAFVMHYKHDAGAIRSDFSPAYALTKLDFILGENLYFKSTFHRFDLHEDVEIDLLKNNTLSFGVQLRPNIVKLESKLVRVPKEGTVNVTISNSEKLTAEVTGSDLFAGMYIKDEMRFGGLTIIPGVRFDYETNIDNYAISPNTIARWQVIDELILKAAGGIYHRLPDGDESSEPFGNNDLLFERAFHAILGFEWNITNLITLDVQGYYKYLDQLVTEIQDKEPDDPRFYDNSGKGYSYGGEILLRQNWTDTLFWWVSYSVSRSMRNDGPNTPYRPFDLDQTHNIIAVASWEFYKGWRIGGRFQFTTGEPYTDIKGGILNADNGTYLPVYNAEKKNGKRNEPWHRLDLRLDKKWLFKKWILYTYLDVQGVYYHANPVGTDYNYDYTERVTERDMPILPSLGVKAEF